MEKKIGDLDFDAGKAITTLVFKKNGNFFRRKLEKIIAEDRDHNFDPPGHRLKG
jgi:hypothetical protein